MSGKIGIFDSGIGGFSVCKQINILLPERELIYLADQDNMPYGPKSHERILELSIAATEFMLENGAEIIVIACNTASAAALHPLREKFPSTKFVGMEPAVKPAAEKSKTGKIGVLATDGTLKGKPYAGVVERFAEGVEIYEAPCAGLALMIENQADEELLTEKITQWLKPMQGIDQLALACTHYPLIIDIIKTVAGKEINVIDPSLAVAKQVERVLGQSNPTDSNKTNHIFYTTGNIDNFKLNIDRFFTDEFTVAYIQWHNGKLLLNV